MPKIINNFLGDFLKLTLVHLVPTHQQQTQHPIWMTTSLQYTALTIASTGSPIRDYGLIFQAYSEVKQLLAAAGYTQLLHGYTVAIHMYIGDHHIFAFQKLSLAESVIFNVHSSILFHTVTTVSGTSPKQEEKDEARHPQKCTPSQTTNVW